MPKWINPRWKELTGEDPPSAPSAEAPRPVDEGTKILAIPRTSRFGPDEELRVNLCEFEGHQYLALRVFAKVADGKYWPVKGKGLSVRLSEAEAVAGALIAGLAMTDRGPGKASGSARQPAGRAAKGRGAARKANNGPDAPTLPISDGDEFSEF